MTFCLYDFFMGVLFGWSIVFAYWFVKEWIEDWNSDDEK